MLRAGGVDAVARGLNAVNPDVGIVEERVEHANRVRSPTHTGHDRVGQSPHTLEELRARLLRDDLLEVAHHRGERVRASGRAEDVVCVIHGCDPITVGLVDRILQRSGPVRTGITSAPKRRMRATLSAWRSVSTSPM